MHTLYKPFIFEAFLSLLTTEFIWQFLDPQFLVPIWLGSTKRSKKETRVRLCPGLRLLGTEFEAWARRNHFVISIQLKSEAIHVYYNDRVVFDISDTCDRKIHCSFCYLKLNQEM